MKEALRKMLQSLLSMKAAIILLFILSAIASLGTLVPQGEPQETYLMHYGGLLGRLILLLGLDDLYHGNPLFIVPGLLLTATVLFCSLRRLRGRKNRTRIGSIILHLSFVVIVAGALVSAAISASEDLSLLPGEQKTLSEGALEGYVVTVEDFKPTYYENGTVSQYYCTLTLKDPDGNDVHKTISVNHPLKKQFVTIYQERYGWETEGVVTYRGKEIPFALREGDSLDLGEGMSITGIFIPNFNESSGSLRSETAEPRNPKLAVGLQKNNMLVDMKILDQGQEDSLNQAKVRFDQYHVYTGLRIKFDPGIPVVFVGFALALLGLALRYTPSLRANNLEKR